MPGRLAVMVPGGGTQRTLLGRRSVGTHMHTSTLPSSWSPGLCRAAGTLWCSSACQHSSRAYLQSPREVVSTCGERLLRSTRLHPPPPTHPEGCARPVSEKVLHGVPQGPPGPRPPPCQGVSYSSQIISVIRVWFEAHLPRMKGTTHHSAPRFAVCIHWLRDSRVFCLSRECEALPC